MFTWIPIVAYRCTASHAVFVLPNTVTVRMLVSSQISFMKKGSPKSTLTFQVWENGSEVRSVVITSLLALVFDIVTRLHVSHSQDPTALLDALLF
jgi:hypothetical protein